MSRPIRIRSVETLAGHTVRLTFTNDVVRDVDLGPYLRGPIFQPIRDDQESFRQVRVDPQAGTICWPGGADIDPDVLYLGRTPAWMASDEGQSRRATEAR
jgi:hypothetical protein